MTNDDDPNDFEPASPPDTLSPAVRRLVKQYGIDVSTIRGTGPDGRLRVADVIESLGGRAAPIERANDDRDDEARLAAPPPGSASGRSVEHSSEPEPEPPRAAAAPHVASFTVFEADLDAWLLHRERERGVDVPLLAYFAAAAARALPLFPAVSPPGAGCDMIRSTEHGSTCVRLEAADLGSLGAIAAALRRPPSPSPSLPPTPSFALHDYGGSGCIVAAPLPLAPEQSAVLGIGRMRLGAGVHSPEAGPTRDRGASCFVALTFDTRRVPLEQANAFVGTVLRYRP